ncbi:MAG: glycosyltransferase family 39 protein [Chloroflexi bacterium]|nr:glycosyltransferase family 39 protein [Chloroflexota bacterium]
MLATILVLALGLRLYRLDGQSFWNDEGTSVALAGRSLAVITRSAAHDIHPPLYYYLLHFWIGLAGSSEAGARSLSVLTGVLVVATTYLLGKQLFGSNIGLLAALLSAFSPLGVYYSQEARMYIMVTLWAVLSIYLLVRLLDRPTYLMATFYLATTTLALYSHYFAAVLLVIENLIFLAWFVGQYRRRLRSLAKWLLLQVIILALYIPWVWMTREQLGIWPAISQPLSLQQLLADLARVFSLGLSVPAKTTPVVLIFTALLLIGLMPPVRYHKSNRKKEGVFAPRSLGAHIIVVLYLAIPIGALYLASLRRPMYDPKFLLWVMPAYYVLVARGICTLLPEQRSYRDVKAWLRALLAGMGFAFTLLAPLTSLANYYFDSQYARDDYRSIAHYIEVIEKTGDAILINAPSQIETFMLYYRGGLPIYPLPRQRPLDEDATQAELKEMITGRNRIFAIFWATDESDPHRFVETWLDEHAYKAIDSWYGDVRFVIYAVPCQSLGERIVHPVDARLGDSIRFRGYSLLTPEVEAGDILQLALFWEATSPIGHRYKVFVHAIDDHGHIVGQRDAEPGGGARLTTTWTPRELIVDNYGVPILPAVPPGRYQIEIGMYGLDDGVRLPIYVPGKAVDDKLLLEPVVVRRGSAPPLAILDLQHHREADCGPLQLLGFTLVRLGFEHDPNVPLRPGDIAHLTLFWLAKETPPSDATLTFRLHDYSGHPIAEWHTSVTEGFYPALIWLPGEIVRDQHNLPLPSGLTPGRYDLHLSLEYAPSAGIPSATLILTKITLEEGG